jgi:hypothetical protein
MLCNRRKLNIFRLNRIFRLAAFLLLIIILYFIWSSNYKNANIKIKKQNKRIKQEESPSKNSICIVLTAEKSITTKGLGIWETWGPGNL